MSELSLETKGDNIKWFKLLIPNTYSSEFKINVLRFFFQKNFRYSHV